MNRAWIWGGFLSLADFSQCVLRNLTDVTKDGSDIVVYHRLGMFDTPSFLSTAPAEKDDCRLKAAVPFLSLRRGSVFRSQVRAMISIHGIF
jgi:hypothetical protein